MNRVWMMTVLSIKGCLRAKWWIPFILSIFVAHLVLFGNFAYLPNPAGSANGILSSYFALLSIGIILSGIILGATSMFLERRTCLIFTLPISRAEIAAGKLFGTQIVVAGGLFIGYAVSLGLAKHFGLEGLAYSRLGLATAFCLSFTYLCLSIPLGFWMPPLPAGVMTIVIANLASTLKSLIDHGWVTAVWMVNGIDVVMRVLPGQVDPIPYGTAFYNNHVYPGAYEGIGRDVFIAMMFFMLLSALAQRKELSMKS